MTEAPGPLPLRCIPVPPEVTAVTGCDCGGLDWHREGCTIFSVQAADAMAAIDAAHAREQAFGAELNARLRTETVAWETAEITVTPDPCWTPEMEAAAQSWLDLIRSLGTPDR